MSFVGDMNDLSVRELILGSGCCRGGVGRRGDAVFSCGGYIRNITNLLFHCAAKFLFGGSFECQPPFSKQELQTIIDIGPA
jgi:hypothetical protein